jgi:hypothetical protein
MTAPGRPKPGPSDDYAPGNEPAQRCRTRLRRIAFTALAPAGPGLIAASLDGPPRRQEGEAPR